MSDYYKNMHRVVKIIDRLTVAINAGSSSDVELGDKFLIFELGDEIIDPTDGQSLGQLELVRGRAEVIHVQEKIATLKSIEFENSLPRKRILKKSHGLSAFGTEEVIEERESSLISLNAEVGDYVKPF
ncbi:hypothetical protein [Pseudovibrio sp. WM33]|uniref:hypothetical protein n=1 Tax=Pseudovibrio sp. WM33 TaxID=1735585 RepID=UPI0007AE41A1|nr:hypothetical protein [Pseudovibrio sp. WM33]KZL23682.1 hypothetical protein PsWM33_02970 [Pseudovibrio sp. WM33]